MESTNPYSTFLKNNHTVLQESVNNSLLKNLNDMLLTRVEVFILTSLFVLTVVGNLAVIFILLLYRTNKTSRSRCLTINNNISRMSFYIIHLSIADTNVAVMSILPQILWRNSIVFNHSHFLCKLVTFSQVFSVYASTFLLIVMAYDRYKCICWPIKSCSWTYRKASVGIILSWLMAAFVSSPQLFLFKIQEMNAKDHLIETCSVKWSSKLHEGLYIMFHLSTQFLIPLIILIFFYTKIFCTVSKNISFKNASIQFERESSHTPTPVKNNLQLYKTKNHSENSICIRKKSSKNPFACLRSLKFNSNVRHKILFTQKKKNQNIKFNNNNKITLEMRANTASVSKMCPVKPNGPKNSINSIKYTPIRQNFPVKALTKSKMKTLKLTLTVVIAYVLCSLPFYVTTMVNFTFDISFKMHSNPITNFLINLSIVTNLLYQLNSCANPFIYMIFNGNACKIIKKKSQNRKKYSKNGASALEGSILTETIEGNLLIKRGNSLQHSSFYKVNLTTINSNVTRQRNNVNSSIS